MKDHPNIGHAERGTVLESDIQRDICKMLEKRGVLFWRSNNIPAPGRNGKHSFRKLPKYVPRGLPDLIVVIAGRMICLEVKRPGMPLNPEQVKFGGKLLVAGASYAVVRSVKDAESAIS